MRILAPRDRSPAEALALGGALLAQAASERVPYLAASVLHGPAVLLGAAQRAGRVVRLDACAAAGVPILRRVTAGTAAHVGARALLWTLALPHVASLAADATARSLLNRNVRGFLKGFTQQGAAAHYFGREWISVRRRPAALLGFETTPGGTVLLEVVAGVDAPIALPSALATDEERAVDRWLGKAPAALGEVMEGDPFEIARAVMEAVALRAGAWGELAGALDAEPGAFPEVSRDDDPMPPGFEAGPGLRVPIGWIDTGTEPATGRVWLGGDVLAPAHVRAAIAEGRADVGEVPVDGATLADLYEAARRAKSTLDRVAGTRPP